MFGHDEASDDETWDSQWYEPAIFKIFYKAASEKVINIENSDVFILTVGVE